MTSFYLAKGKRAVPLVTDDEKGFTNAIETNLTNDRRLYCWNHTINAAKAWLKAGEIPMCICYLRDLFHKETEKEYEARLEELNTIWSQAFFTYYKEELHKKVWLVNAFICSNLRLFTSLADGI